MKRLIFAGLVMALCSGSTVFAQSNNNYSDDVYYNGSQAERDAKADAKKEKKQRQTQGQEEQYNSSTGDGYADNNYDGNARVYNNSYNTEDDSYIDYDDDSYTSRMRRFYYPMNNVGYWGGVYSPFWSDPFYTNPYYGWGGWYTPGFSIGIGTGWGWGGGPYWNNCWGMNTWFGYGGFGSWYSPYFGGFGGWGYGSGYWNGYYAGFYDGRFGGGGIYNPVRTVNYGPRTSSVGLTSVGAYGRNARMNSIDRSSNMVQPFRSANTNGANGGRAIELQNSDRGSFRSSNGNNNGRSGEMQSVNDRGSFRTANDNGARNGNAINLDRSNTRVFEDNGRGARNMQVNPDATNVQPSSRRSGGFFNFGRGNNSGNSDRGFQRSESNGFSQPSRGGFERSAPQQNRSFSNPAPSRSFGNGGGGGFSSPSRSGGGGFSGGGARSGGGGRGR